MPKLDLDQLKELKDPIEFHVEGKDFVVPDLRPSRIQKALDALARLDSDSEHHDPEAQMGDVFASYLAIMTDAPKEGFEELDLRYTAKIVEFLTDQVGIKQEIEQKGKKRKR